MNNTNNIINDDEIIDLSNIKDEPIIKHNEIPIEETVIKKKKLIKFTDIMLIFLIIIMLIVFAIVVVKLK